MAKEEYECGCELTPGGKGRLEEVGDTGTYAHMFDETGTLTGVVSNTLYQCDLCKRVVIRPNNQLTNL